MFQDSCRLSEVFSNNSLVVENTRSAFSKNRILGIPHPNCLTAFLPWGEKTRLAISWPSSVQARWAWTPSPGPHCLAAFLPWGERTRHAILWEKAIRNVISSPHPSKPGGLGHLLPQGEGYKECNLFGGKQEDN